MHGRASNGKKNWLLIKSRDDQSRAEADGDVLDHSEADRLTVPLSWCTTAMRPWPYSGLVLNPCDHQRSGFHVRTAQQRAHDYQAPRPGP